MDRSQALSLAEEIRRGWPGLEPGAKIVVGVSGGPDSLALLGLLNECRYPLVVAHLDHGLRPESEAEAEFVRQLAARWGLPFALGRERVGEWAQQHRQSVEEAGRILRYRFLVGVALQANARWVAVGHTADDQAETVLMHFLRGTGPEGLRGMAAVQDLGTWVEGLEAGRVFLVRPLLKVTREQTEAYCREKALLARRDPTNVGPAFLRSRMRSDLLPILRRYNPQLRAVLCRLADVMAGDVEVIEAELDRVWLEMGVRLGRNQVGIPRKNFLAQPKGLRRGLLRRACRRLSPGMRDLSYRHIERALDFAENPPAAGRVEICQGLVLRFSDGRLILGRQAAEPLLPPPWVGEEIAPGGRIRLEDLGWVIEARPAREWEWRRVRGGPGRWEAWLDRDRLEGSLRVRVRARGDRFRPLGMDREVRLGDFLSAHHLPVDLRDRWPLICDGSGIVWIPGLQISERPKLCPATRRALHLLAWQEGPGPRG